MHHAEWQSGDEWNSFLPLFFFSTSPVPTILFISVLLSALNKKTISNFVWAKWMGFAFYVCSQLNTSNSIKFIRVSGDCYYHVVLGDVPFALLFLWNGRWQPIHLNSWSAHRKFRNIHLTQSKYESNEFREMFYRKGPMIFSFLICSGSITKQFICAALPRDFKIDIPWPDFPFPVCSDWLSIYKWNQLINAISIF